MDPVTLNPARADVTDLAPGLGSGLLAADLRRPQERDALRRACLPRLSLEAAQPAGMEALPHRATPSG